MTQYLDYISEIREASENNKLVFFVGAGVSRLSGYPGWIDLVNKFYTKLYNKRKRKRFTNEECLQIPEKFFGIYGKEAFDRILKETFDVDKKSNIVHDKMMLLNPVHFITTNYDELIEQACNKRGKYFSTISSDNDVAHAESSKYILKVHGDFKNGFNSDSIVLMDKDYLDYENDYPLTSNMMKSIMATHTIVFIGYGLGDHNIKLLLNWVRNLQKEGYKKPFFIRTDGEALDDGTRIYYEGKGLRIIESCFASNKQNASYEDRYTQVLDMLIDTRESHFLDKDSDRIVEFIYNRLNPLLRLPSVRKTDLKCVFDMKYSFETTGSIVLRNKDGVDYLKQFFALDESVISTESQKKYSEIMSFFDRNGVLGMFEDVKNKLISTALDVQNPIYHCKFDEIREILKKPATSLDDKYRKAYFMACVGEFMEAYELFCEILYEAKAKNDWLMHYLSQINRYRIFQSIRTMKAYGIRSGDDPFVQRIEVEMKDYKIDDVFDSMPFEFKTKYKSLRALSDNYYMYSDTVRLFERINKAGENRRKGSITFGLTPSDEALLEMNDNLRFLYENHLWLTSFKDVKDYTKNAMLMMFDTAEYEVTRERSSTDMPFFPERQFDFHVDYHDFVNVCKSFKVADIANLESRCKLDRFEFRDQNRIEDYLLRVVNEVVRHFSSGGMNYFLYAQFIEEAKTAVYFSKHVQLSDQAYERIVEALLHHYPRRDVDEQKSYHWTERLFVKHKLPNTVIPVIEKYLVNQALKHADDNYHDERSRHFAGLIKHYHEYYTSDTLSSFALSLDENQSGMIDFMYCLSPILTKEAKEFLIQMKKITTINDVINALRIGAISDANGYADIVIEFIDQRYSKIVADQKVGSYSMYMDDYPLEFAVQYFLGEFNDDRMKNFLGVKDEFDMFVSPETFNFNKFEVGWLRNYIDDLIKEMARNKYMSPYILSALKSSAKEAKDNRYYEILVECFLQ